jgi:heme A synthase
LNEQSARSFRLFGIFTLLYTVAVIIFGAWVRITGSGAGCGKHWPSCHGSAVPRAPSVETMIEFTHRLTSGLAFVLVVILAIAAFRVFHRGHPSRYWSIASVIFMITEALIGAGLVIFGLVETNDSAARAAAMSIHLVNTFLLTGAMSITIFYGRIDSYRRALSQKGPRRTAVIIAAIAILIMGMTGAVTALGDTLYPVDPDTGKRLMERIALEQHPTAHFLVRMRILHPSVAIIGALLVAGVTAGFAFREPGFYIKRWGYATAALMILQLLVGALNVVLHAPGWMQLIHLGMATLIWISFVLFSSHLLEGRRYATDRAST